MKLILLTLGAALLAGCASAITPFTSPDGRQAYAMACGNGFSRCYDKARELCGGDYDVIDRISGNIVTAYNGMASTVNNDRLYVACKAPTRSA